MFVFVYPYVHQFAFQKLPIISPLILYEIRALKAKKGQSDFSERKKQ